MYMYTDESSFITQNQISRYLDTVTPSKDLPC